MLTDHSAALQSAQRTLKLECDGLMALANILEGDEAHSFLKAIETMQHVTAQGGRIVVSGMGKSGHIGHKIAATLASTGTPAFFVHPAEASHGDLGMVTHNDAILALSWTGETTELHNIVDYAGRFRVPLIAITSNAKSALAKASNVALILPKIEEACPHGLAPTTSALIQLALGDALAVTLLEAKGFSAGDFKVFHPGGQLGANLRYVGDIMHIGAALPLVSVGTQMADAIIMMSSKGFGCVVVKDEDGCLAGVITDGDLRRHMRHDLMEQNVENIMTIDPKSMNANVMVSKAIDFLNSHSLTVLLVVDEKNKPIGILHMHDLLRIGVA